MSKKLLQRNKELGNQIKMLVAERKQNKIKLEDLESQMRDLKDRLFQAERKNNLTANLGNKKISELRDDIFDLHEKV